MRTFLIWQKEMTSVQLAMACGGDQLLATMAGHNLTKATKEFQLPHIRRNLEAFLLPHSKLSRVTSRTSSGDDSHSAPQRGSCWHLFFAISGIAFVLGPVIQRTWGAHQSCTSPATAYCLLDICLSCLEAPSRKNAAYSETTSNNIRRTPVF